MRRPDVIDGKIADHGQHVLLDAGAPLPAVLGVLPAVFVAGKALLEAVAERHGRGSGSDAGGALRMFVRDGVDAVEAQLAGLPGPLTRLREGEHMKAAEAHVARTAVGDEAVYPLLGAALCNAQIEPTAVAIHAGALRLLHLHRREPVQCPRHVCPSAALRLVHIGNADIERQRWTRQDGGSKERRTVTEEPRTLADMGRQSRR